MLFPNFTQHDDQISYVPLKYDRKPPQGTLQDVCQLSKKYLTRRQFCERNCFLRVEDPPPQNSSKNFERFISPTEFKNGFRGRHLIAVSESNANFSFKFFGAELDANFFKRPVKKSFFCDFIVRVVFFERAAEGSHFAH